MLHVNSLVGKLYYSSSAPLVCDVSLYVAIIGSLPTYVAYSGHFWKYDLADIFLAEKPLWKYNFKT